MDKKDLSNLGKEIKDMIKSQVNSVDLHKLNNDVGSTVNSALDLAFEEVRKAMGSIQVESQRFKASPIPQPAPQPQPMNPVIHEVKPPVMKQISSVPSIIVPNAPVGKVEGTLLSFFGSLGIGVLGTAIVVVTALGITATSSFPAVVFILLPFLAASVVMEMRGTNIRNRVKRFKRYLTLFKGRNNCSIKELSSYSQLSERFLVKDLRKMIAIGTFPQAHINDEKSLILLNRGSYENYLKEQAIFEARQLEDEQKNFERKKTKDSLNINSQVGKEIWETIEEGKSFIREIQLARGAIRDVLVTQKIYRMEEIISKIIDHVEIHPEQRQEIRKFMEYYLPTTIKLLNAYKEFENQPIQGDNIKTARNEIQNVLDTINVAFENLFDSLFEDAAWDVSTDISVLQTMLAQEGLTEKDFNLKKNSIGGMNK